LSAACVAAVADQAVFRPSGKPWMLSERHVPLDEIVRSNTKFEELALRRLTTQGATESVAVVGVSGSGKSSLVAWVSARLPESHAAIRLPISALEDPTDTGEVLKLSLGVILDVIRLDAAEREEIHIERTEQRTATRSPTGITGGRIGGGAIPVAVNVEVGSLRQEYSENRLDGEYLAGVNRVVAILLDKDVTPVFVLDDTEAIVGAAVDQTRVDGFFEGPLHKFVQEIEAPCVVAVQEHLTQGSEPYRRLAASMEIINIPRLGDEARDALGRILSRRLQVAESDCLLADIMGDDAIDGLVQFYDETGGDVRKTLAAAHNAAEDAAAMSAELVRASHVRVGAANWR
jgi:hypothetical protein